MGYVGLTGGFQQTTSAELDEAVASLKKQGMKSLLLDLRGNPGGILEQAIEVVSRFVPAGQTVVSVKGRSRYAVARELRASGKMMDDLPLVVMINGGSASASEIVAGAIQDYDRGVDRRERQFWKRAGPGRVSAALRHRADIDDRALLHALRALAAA